MGTRVTCVTRVTRVTCDTCDTCDCAAVARFQENEGVQKSIHNAIRYHADKDFKSAYHAELEQQIQQRDDRAQQVRDQDVTISRQLEVQ